MIFESKLTKVFMSNFSLTGILYHFLPEMSHPNPLGNDVRVGDGKTDFLEALADWLEKWHDDCPAFTLTSKTSYALVLTLRAQSGLIKELLSEGMIL